MTNVTTYFFIIFIIIIILIIFILIGFWYFSVQSNQALSLNTLPGAFLQSCRNSNFCQNGLKCDGESYLCKKEQNQTCQNYYDCVNPLYCSGICTNGARGDLNQFCPCFEGLTCVPNTTESNLPKEANICKYIPGHVCTENSQCSSNSCINNICSI